MRTIPLLAILFGVTGCGPRRTVGIPAPDRPDSIVSVPAKNDQSSVRQASTESVTTPLTASIQSNPAGAPDSNPLREINRVLEDAFFDFDRYQLRSDAIEALRKNAGQLRGILDRQPGLMLIVEGHCDELGSAEYNLALGERRAEVAREFLVQLGIPESRLRTLTWGKERPLCTEPTEECRQRNRRAHVMYSE
jgi:peptidoglycan-associated lipoprotein